MEGLSHVDEQGRARMVDVSAKADTEREAVARGLVLMKPETLKLVSEGGISKGEVLSVARVAGIMAAKHTPYLVPMCHPLLLTHVEVDLRLDPDISAIEITATVRTTGKTGVEMEALTAVTGSCPHHLRHVQGRRQGHANRESEAGAQDRRQIGGHNSGVTPLLSFGFLERYTN